MKHSTQHILLIDHRTDSLSFCYMPSMRNGAERTPAPLALSREIRCHAPKNALGCSLAGDPSANLRCALEAAGGRIDWASTSVIFGAPHDPFAGGIASLAGALKNLELLISRSPRELTVQTRSSLILLALPLLRSSPSREVRFAFEAADDSLHHRLLPSFLRPSERVETMETLQGAGVRLTIQAAPVITRRDTSGQIRRLVDVLERSAAPVQIYPIDSLLTTRIDPALISLHRARRMLHPQSHRLVRNALLKSIGADPHMRMSA